MFKWLTSRKKKKQPENTLHAELVATWAFNDPDSGRKMLQAGVDKKGKSLFVIIPVRMEDVPQEELQEPLTALLSDLLEAEEKYDRATGLDKLDV